MFATLGIAVIRALIAIFRFPARLIRRRGRSTRRVRRAFKALRPLVPPKLTTLTMTMAKSRIFHPLRKYEFSPFIMNPSETIFNIASITNNHVGSRKGNTAVGLYLFETF